MGIPRGSARLLLEEARRRPFRGALLELGKMQVFFGADELARWAQQHRVALAEVPQLSLSADPRLAAQGCLSDRSFFSLLGFDEVTSADISRWEGADVTWDFNQPAPAELHQRFDAVYEGGTLQHVFDLPQALENVFQVLKPGGRVIHGMSPSSNHVDHGFYMFSPTFFADYYAANGFTIEKFYFFDYVPYWIDGRFYSTRWRIRPYRPGCLDHLSYGRWGGRQTGLFVVATKGENATGHVRPQQGAYRAVWRQEGERQAVETPVAGRTRPASRLLRLWKLAREILRRWGPKRLPPVVARY
ncbi:MAG: class I SAM-dependent methyltransferase [Acidobacteria bacterium]|nr:MAG: class I SAM-dependent methyltransferase [Acidobacteriota bacterium]